MGNRPNAAAGIDSDADSDSDPARRLRSRPSAPAPQRVDDGAAGKRLHQRADVAPIRAQGAVGAQRGGGIAARGAHPSLAVSELGESPVGASVRPPPQRLIEPGNAPDAMLDCAADVALAPCEVEMVGRALVTDRLLGADE